MLARNPNTEGLITRGQIYAHPTPISTQFKSVEVVCPKKAAHPLNFR